MQSEISSKLLAELNVKLRENGLTQSTINKVEPKSGGSINNAYALITDKERFFVKINTAGNYPQLFEKEQKGLLLLEKSTSLTIPKTYFIDSTESNVFLVMELIEPGIMKQDFWEVFAEGLASLHKRTSNQFGLEYNNYIGSLVQKNDLKSDWLTFFVENRLQDQVKMAFDKGLVDLVMLSNFDKLYKKLNSILPVESPSLIHGDLWSGNFMVGKNGEPVIMDPAVYFGHREMDIAMMHLFGGFDRKLFETYNELYPLERGWEKRIEICNLYPLLVHVNLFGGGYVSRVKGVLKGIV